MEEQDIYMYLTRDGHQEFEPLLHTVHLTCSCYKRSLTSTNQSCPDYSSYVERCSSLLPTHSLGLEGIKDKHPQTISEKHLVC